MTGPLAGVRVKITLDLEPDFYREFVSRLGVDVAGWPDQDDRAAWPRLRELIAAAVAARPQAEWARVYEGTDACVTPVLTFDEAARYPHNAERGVFARIGGIPAPVPGATVQPDPGAVAGRAAQRARGRARTHRDLVPRGGRSWLISISPST